MSGVSGDVTKEPSCPEPLLPTLAASCAPFRESICGPCRAGKRTEGREGPVQSGQRVRVKVKVKGMVRLGLLVGASAGFRDPLRLRGG